MSAATEHCAWCERELPEPGHDAWLVAEDKTGAEKPACVACARLYKPVVVRVGRPQ